MQFNKRTQAVVAMATMEGTWNKSLKTEENEKDLILLHDNKFLLLFNGAGLFLICHFCVSLILRLVKMK